MNSPSLFTYLTRTIICLQELWSFTPYMNSSLHGYHPLVYKLRNSCQGGRVGIYIKSNIKFSLLPQYSIFVERILETIFVEIILPNNSKYIVGSIYRPGATHPTLTPLQLFTEFYELFKNILDNISNYSDLLLMGDINIDVLQYGHNPRATDFIELFFLMVYFN